MTIRHTLAAALAATAIAAPAASAEPAGTHASAALAPAQEQQRDLRSPDAIDAAVHPRPAPYLAPVSPGHPSEVGNTSPLPPPTDERPVATGDAVDWTTLGLGIVGLVLFMAGVVALATRTRPAPRVSA
jgi:hypothetical protein